MKITKRFLDDIIIANGQILLPNNVTIGLVGGTVYGSLLNYFTNGDDKLSLHAKVVHIYGGVKDFDRLKLEVRTFVDIPIFNQIFPTHVQFYYKHENKFVYLASTLDVNFICTIYTYLVYIQHNEYLSKLSEPIAKKAISNFIKGNKQTLPDKIPIISNDPEVGALLIFDPDKFKMFRTPAWDSFLTSFEFREESELFLAFIYSIFKGDDFNRQILFLSAPGNTGKSAVVNTIYSFCESILQGFATTMPRFGDMFATCNFDTSRLTIISDNSERNLINEDLIKQITGNDVITIRKQRINPYTKRVYQKLIIVSNIAPYINELNPHETTRCLYISLDIAKSRRNMHMWFRNNPTLNWDSLLLDEMPSIMAKGKVQYDKYFKNGTFKLPEHLHEKRKRDCGSMYEAVICEVLSNIKPSADGSRLRMSDLILDCSGKLNQALDSRVLYNELRNQLQIRSFNVLKEMAYGDQYDYILAEYIKI